MSLLMIRIEELKMVDVAVHIVECIMTLQDFSSGLHVEKTDKFTTFS